MTPRVPNAPILPRDRSVVDKVWLCLNYGTFTVLKLSRQIYIAFSLMIVSLLQKTHATL